ncbi:hypothetical protein A3B18_01755 [Candidatus Giovannonibacteria bacterium RIFCSPLOWO2_01_FULL_46_13]|uniref:Uncharacterized protein n=1 Tax=Candidatus Giovannonibacteria bacterium RIFCSPLOWO2_01_FULL_46_13 TaxID=1798352 RepID=A0A1F5X5K6_9BACT|nr:MAG: hypothetical protein A3B18_01755 [Candidatus Giovannonibacteria bacterium RIFCSPLOWO2_01_FULL_46_13]
MENIGFEFSSDAAAELDQITERLKSSRGNAINHGLGKLKWIVEELEQGSRILVERKDGEIVEVEFPEIESMLRWAKFWKGVDRLLTFIKRPFMRFFG